MATYLEHQMSLNSFELLGIAIKLVLKWEITYEYHLYIILCYISPNTKKWWKFPFQRKMFYSVNHLGTSASHRNLEDGVAYRLFTESKDDTQVFF